MQITTVMAAIAVSDLERAETFYSGLLGVEPTTRPMDGLIEYHFDGAVLQVAVDADRAGGSLATIVVDAVDDAEGATSAGGEFRQVVDPDGNAVTLLAQ